MTNKMSAAASVPPLSRESSERDSDLSEHFQQLGEELKCSLCLEYYDNPVALPCQHNFCRECIKGVARPRGPNKQEIECPLCRKKFQLDGSSADACMAKLPRNFQLAGIVEKFRAAEKEKTRSEELEFERQMIQQIELSNRQQEEQERQQQQQQQQEQHQQQQASSEANQIQASLCPPAPAAADAVSSGPIPTCKMCTYPGVIHCQECDDDFCLECQQIHPHGESSLVEDGSQDDLKAPSQSQDRPQHDDQQQQQRLQQLQDKQLRLQFDLEQQQALSNFSPSPVWQQQQTDRWEELQQQRQEGTKRQVSEEYPPPPQQEDMPQEPLSWPLGQQDRQLYQRQFHQPAPQQVSPTSPSSEPRCSYCHFPGVTHCEQCGCYFCWQCVADRHGPGKGSCEGNKPVNVVSSGGTPPGFTSLGPAWTQQAASPNSGNSSPSSLPMVNDVQIPVQLAMGVAESLVPSQPKEKKENYKIPYVCGISEMGPGKHITVVGHPKEKCTRFHINLMCDRNAKSGDIALHFNPRFTFPKGVVRNSRIGGKYGSEERKTPNFPFSAGRSFKIEIICLIDEFQVAVDNKPFISYKHRIRELRSIKVFLVSGDVKITSVEGCN